jgi:adenylosuccinate synthase
MVSYEILDKKEGIEEFISDSQIVVVEGGFFGDEAKGKTVDLLGDSVDASARVNSGENAGHTMVNDGVKVVTHLVGSGVVSGKPTFIGENCVMDPVTFHDGEVMDLIDGGFDTSCLKVGNVNVVAPWHKVVDLMGNPNASTGKGMSQIHQDIAGKRAPKLEDFLNGDNSRISKSFSFWKDHLAGRGLDFEMAREVLKDNPKVPEHVKEFLSLENDLDRINYVTEKSSSVFNYETFPELTNPRADMRKILENGGKILLEGPQSFYLANNEGTHPSTSTSAHTTSEGIVAASGLSGDKYAVKTLAVVKVPSSRVGSGANPCGYVEQDWFCNRNLTKDKLEELGLEFNHVYNSFLDTIDNLGLSCADKTVYTDSRNNPVSVNGEYITVNEAMAIASSLENDEFGATTGKPRVTGPIDLPHLAHLVKSETPNISVSCLDRFDGLETILAVESYVYTGKGYKSVERNYVNGDSIGLDDELPNENILRDCDPVYRKLSGWKSTRNLKTGDLLDSNVGNFINYLETETGCNVVSFGNGPDTNDIVFLKKQY